MASSMTMAPERIMSARSALRPRILLRFRREKPSRRSPVPPAPARPPLDPVPGEDNVGSFRLEPPDPLALSLRKTFESFPDRRHVGLPHLKPVPVLALSRVGPGMKTARWRKGAPPAH